MRRLSSRQFGFYFLLLTVAFALMILNVRWLTVGGCGVLLVASGAVRGWKFSSQIGRAWCLAAIAFIIGFRAHQRGDFWGNDPQSALELAAIFAVWLGCMGREYRAWRKALTLPSAT